MENTQPKAANETNEATTEEIPDSVFIMPDSLKQQEQNKSASEKDVKVTKKKSSSSRKALKVECAKISILFTVGPCADTGFTL